MANSVTTDAAARFVALAEEYEKQKPVLWRHTCNLLGETAKCFPTGEELAAFRMIGVDVDVTSLTCYEIAYVLGIHFRAGEWLEPRCGSVFTAVIDGRSVYGRFERFWKDDNDEDHPGYTSVSWFSEPHYRFREPLVVQVTLDGSDLDDDVGCIIPITSVDPSRILIEPNEDSTSFHMMRDSGFDIIR